MKRMKLVVAYDGTAYNGWQVQPGVKTIEGELNRCLSELLGEEIQVIGPIPACMHFAMWRFLTRIPGFPEKKSVMH